MLVPGVDDCERPRLREEKPPLRLEVRLHVAVKVEVILAEIREDEDAEAHAVEPVEDGRVRRRLHRARAVAGVEHLAERPLQVDRLGCRPHDAAALAADARLDRPEQARPPPRGSEDREQEERRRRLPARAGDARDSSSFVGSPKNTSAAGAIAARASATTICGTWTASSRSTTSATAPPATASVAKSWPSTRAPGTQKKSAPGTTARAS